MSDWFGLPPLKPTVCQRANFVGLNEAMVPIGERTRLLQRASGGASW
jgi:uncharacterized protein (UPF0210 family)